MKVLIRVNLVKSKDDDDNKDKKVNDINLQEALL